jgi:hypothetical protein
MQDVETMLAQAKSYRAAAAAAPNKRIYELLLEVAAEFHNAAMNHDPAPKAGLTPPPSGRT